MRNPLIRTLPIALFWPFALVLAWLMFPEDVWNGLPVEYPLVAGIAVGCLFLALAWVEAGESVE